jgi:hypothetical protein
MQDSQVCESIIKLNGLVKNIIPLVREDTELCESVEKISRLVNNMIPLVREDDRFYKAMAKLRGLINDIIHPLLSSAIFMDDLMVENSEINKNSLLIVDSQIISAINYLLEMRSIILYYIKYIITFSLGLELMSYSSII